MMEQTVDIGAAGDNVLNKSDSNMEDLKSVDHVEHQVKLEKFSLKYHELTQPFERQNDQTNNTDMFQVKENDIIRVENTADMSDPPQESRLTEVPTQNGDQTSDEIPICQSIDNSDNIPQTGQTIANEVENLESEPINLDSPIEQLTCQGQDGNSNMDGSVASKHDSDTNGNMPEEIEKPSDCQKSESVTMVTPSKDLVTENVVPQTLTSDDNSKLDVKDPSQSQIKSQTEDIPERGEVVEVTDKGDNVTESSSREKQEEFMDILGNGLLTKKVSKVEICFTIPKKIVGTIIFSTER